MAALDAIRAFRWSCPDGVGTKLTLSSERSSLGNSWMRSMAPLRLVLETIHGPEEGALARAHAKAGDRAAAVQEYRHILQIAPDQPEARAELARLSRGPGS